MRLYCRLAYLTASFYVNLLLLLYGLVNLY